MGLFYLLKQTPCDKVKPPSNYKENTVSQTQNFKLLLTAQEIVGENIETYILRAQHATQSDEQVVGGFVQIDFHKTILVVFELDMLMYPETWHQLVLTAHKLKYGIIVHEGREARDRLLTHYATSQQSMIWFLPPYRTTSPTRSRT